MSAGAIPIAERAFERALTVGGARERSQSSERPRAAYLLAAVLLTTTVLLPLTFLPFIEDAFALPKLIFLAVTSGVIVICVALAAALNRRAPIPLPVAVPLAVYLCLNAVALAVSTDSSHSLFGERLQYQGFASILIYATAFYAGAIGFRSRSLTTLLFWTISLAGSAVSVYGLAQMLDLDPVSWSYGSGPPERAFSSIGQANALAAYLVLVLPVTTMLVAQVNGRARLLIYAIIVLNSVVLALTFSRAGYLALALVIVVGLLPFVWRLPLRRAILTGGAAGCAVFIASAVLLASPGGTGERVADRAASITDLHDISLQKHIGMWLVSGRIALDNPLAGTGQETYPEMFQRYRRGDLPGFGVASARPESPHNAYLSIASSAGFPALAAYVALIGTVLLLLYRSPGENANRPAVIAITAALLGHLVTDMFMTPDLTSSWMFWLLMGVGIALASRRPHQPSTWAPRSGFPIADRFRSLSRTPP